MEPNLAWTADAPVVCALAGPLPSISSPERAAESLLPEAMDFAGDDDADIDTDEDEDVYRDGDEASDDDGDDDYDEEDDYDGDHRQGRRSRDDDHDRHGKRGKRRRHGHGSDRVRGRGTRRVID